MGIPVRVRWGLARWLVRAGAGAATLGLGAATLGCSTHLAGTNDAALEYAVGTQPAAGPALPADFVAAGAQSRLAAALVPSDVEATADGHVRVVVDAEVAGAVDELLEWRGGLSVWREDPGYVIDPKDTTAVRPMTAPGASGEERWWQGRADAVARIVRDCAGDRSHAVFAERLPNGEYRTRAALAPPVVTLGLGAAAITNVAPIEHGRALAVSLAPAAASVLAAERSAHPRERVLLTRGTSALVQAMTIDQAAANPVVLGFGDDVLSYTRAERAKLLLRSPVLPALRRVSAAALPDRIGLAAACAVLPFLLSFAWLFFVRRFDRARPEPLWLVAATFGLGCVSVVPAALVEAACTHVSPWLDPTVATLGGQLWALPLAIGVSTLVVGAVEEGAKFLGAWTLARHRREFDEPVDGIIYGCAAALGFAAVENVKYFAFGRMSGVVIAMRAFETVPAHMFFGALWGYAMGRALVSRSARVFPLFALAALAHGTFDALLSTDGTQMLAAVLVLVLAVTFVVLLRRALRHGAVASHAVARDAPPPTEPLPASALPRTYFRAGSAGASLACATAMVACAFGLTVLGTVFEMMHHRVNPVVVAISALLLLAFGVAAWGLSETIPLDVAIDAQGLTFAGSRTPWTAITGTIIDRRGRRAFVRLETRDGPVRVGPTDEATAVAILASIRAGRG